MFRRDKKIKIKSQLAYCVSLKVCLVVKINLIKQKIPEIENLSHIILFNLIMKKAVKPTIEYQLYEWRVFSINP